MPKRAALTTGSGGAYSSAMSENTGKAALEQELRKLEKRLEEVLAAVGQLKDENRSLRARQETLSTERSALLHKNEQVRTRVEAMIGRLKSMEHGA